MLDLSIIIVSYNVRHFLEHCISSVYQAVRGMSYEIFVIDNASQDETVSLFGSPRENLTFIRNDENLGFSKANNQALRQCKGKYILLLNPDTVVQEDTFKQMIAFLDQHPEAGAAGSKILNPDGTLQAGCRRSYPTPSVSFFRLSGLGRLFPGSKKFSAYNLTYLDPDQVAEVDAISGSFMMVRREVLEKVGCLDEDFFMYGEDLDWCFRIKEAGWKIYYVPDTQIIHFKGESSRNRGFRNLRSFYQSMLIFVRKHYPGRRFLPFSLLITSAIYLRGGMDFLGQRLRRLLIPIIDVALMNVVMLMAYLIRFSQVGLDLPYREPANFLIVHSVATIVWFTSFQVSRTYTNRPYSPLTAWYGVTISFIIMTSVTFFFKEYAFSRLASLYTGLMGSAVLMGWRVVINVFFKSRWGRSLFRKRTLIVGGLETSTKVLQQITTHLIDDYRVVGVIDDDEENLTKPVGDVRVIGTTAQLSQLVKEFDIQQLLIAPFSIPYEKILYITSMLKKDRVQIKLVSEGYDTIVSKPKIEKLPDIPIIKMK